MGRIGDRCSRRVIDMTGRLNKQRLCIGLQTILAGGARAISSGSALVQTTLSNKQPDKAIDGRGDHPGWSALSVAMVIGRRAVNTFYSTTLHGKTRGNWQRRGNTAVIDSGRYGRDILSVVWEAGGRGTYYSAREPEGTTRRSRNTNTVYFQPISNRGSRRHLATGEGVISRGITVADWHAAYPLLTSGNHWDIR